MRLLVSGLLFFALVLGFVILPSTSKKAEAETETSNIKVADKFKQFPFDKNRNLKVPKGGKVSVFTRIEGARFMTFLPDRSLLVSSPSTGTIVRIKNGKNMVWLKNLKNPHDLVVNKRGKNFWLYVAQSNKITKYKLLKDSLGPEQIIVDGLPDSSTKELKGKYGHQLKNIAIHKNKLYVSIASTCNACKEDTQSDPIRGAIYQYSLRGKNKTLFAKGLRNAEGLDFSPNSQLWVSVNNRDNIAYPFKKDFDGDGQIDYGKVIPKYVDNHPPEELTRVTKKADYGWPFCNPNPDTKKGYYNMPFVNDFELNKNGMQTNCKTKTKISRGIQAHSAPLGISFLYGSKVSKKYRQGAVVALHGSWNRTNPAGYKVVWYPFKNDNLGKEKTLLSGFVQNGKVWGRPVDVIAGPDGKLYVSDDYSGTIYTLSLSK